MFFSSLRRVPRAGAVAAAAAASAAAFVAYQPRIQAAESDHIYVINGCAPLPASLAWPQSSMPPARGHAPGLRLHFRLAAASTWRCVRSTPSPEARSTTTW